MFGNLMQDKDKVYKMNAIVLAFVGDAVYSLYVRQKLSLQGDYKAGVLSNLATDYVRASAQADKVDKLIPLLTEEELALFKRARNTHKGAKAKSASIGQYNKSTGFEAVLGYLYLSGQMERLNQLLNYGEAIES